MRLKTVQVHGFKTFAHPTTFHFQDGITAIVGPNGCGKSNIADAIRWALGEQSPSNLRTKKTEDLIFTGSATRPKMGMAEVALTLENPFSFEVEQPRDHANGADPAPSDNGSSPNGGAPDADTPRAARPSTVVEEILRARPSEVTILRRAYRSGENEYLINRQRVRLRDVQELLQRWGLARLTYAVIGQGLVDQALSLRAEERRALFEEAAGIGLYQNKKANALEKLEETRTNLVRVNDIINEIAPRLPSLARQADRAGKYESVATALNANLKQWYAYNWAQSQAGFITATEQENTARETLNARRAEMHDLAAQLTEARRTAQTLRAKLAEHRRGQQQRESEFAARERELAVVLERVRFAETQHADAERDVQAGAAFLAATLAALEQLTPPGLSLSLQEPQDIDATVEQIVRDQDERARETLARQLNELESKLQSRSDADSGFQAREQELVTSEQRLETDYQAETERLAAQHETDQSLEREKFSLAADKLVQDREVMEYQRARALVNQRLATLRLVEFETPPAIVAAAAADDSAPPDLAAHLISLQDALPLYESALASVAGLAARADDLARRERAMREYERTLERVRQQVTETRGALTLAERDVQAAKSAEVNVRRDAERAERERIKELERARLERERARDRAREQLRREREKLARESERLQREKEQLTAQRERLLQDRARDQERERERVRERVLEKQREQERERERAAREYQQTQERLTRDHERAQRELEAKTARVAAFAAQITEVLAAREIAQAQVDEMRAELESRTRPR